MLQQPLSRSHLAVSIVLPVLAIFAVAARFWARRMQKASLAGDDWTILAALIVAMGVAGMNIYCAARDWYGVSIYDWTAEMCVPYSLLYWLSYAICHIPWALTKISILLFYKRIFIKRSFVITVYLMIILTVLWFLGSLIPACLVYIPVSDFWTDCANHDSRPRAVVNDEILLITVSITDLILDVLIMCLPFPVIRSLHLPKSRKFLFSILFGTGLLCCIATSVRIYWAWRLYEWDRSSQAEHTVISVMLDIWQTVEAFLSIIAACLPALSPLFRRGEGIMTLVNLVTRRTSSCNNNNGSNTANQRGTADGSALSLKTVKSCGARGFDSSHYVGRMDSRAYLKDTSPGVPFGDGCPKVSLDSMVREGVYCSPV